MQYEPDCDLNIRLFVEKFPWKPYGTLLGKVTFATGSSENLFASIM
jgi:hypothetical protein